MNDSLQLAGKRAVAVVFSNYPADPRPRRAAEALEKEGMHLEVICLKEMDHEPEREIFNGVEITRIPLKRRRGGKLTYIAQYGSFVFLSGAMLAAREAGENAKVIEGVAEPAPEVEKVAKPTKRKRRATPPGATATGRGPCSGHCCRSSCLPASI